MNDYIYEFSYRNVTYYFNEPQLPEKTPEDKIKILAICNNCLQKHLTTLQDFKVCVGERGTYFCKTCRRKNKITHKISDFPKELNLKIIENNNENNSEELKNNSIIEVECQECHQIKRIPVSYFYKTFFVLDTYICTTCKRRRTNLKFYGSTTPCGNKDIIQKSKNTCLNKYGVTSYTQTEEFKVKAKETSLRKFGVENAMQSEEIKQKMVKNTLEKYGVEYTTQLESSKEKSRQTCLEKYGVESYTQTKECQEKIKQTNLERYGVENYAQTEECKEKIKKTSLEKYGVENYAQTEECKEKFKQDNLEKYGVPFYKQTEEFKEKSKQTCLEKYGTPYSSQAEEVKEKARQTNLERYGVSSYSQTPEFLEKTKQTCLERYGVENYAQSEDYQKTAYKKYKYKGMNFDSSWELAYHIFNEDHNIPTIRLPQSIEYFLNDKSHHYFPDFLVGNQLIEIKSPEMLNEDYSLKPLWKDLNECQTEEEKQHLYNLCAAKTQCMRENNVQILSRKEIKPYLKYIRDTYGKDYLKQFKQEDDQNTSGETDILDEEIEDIDELD